MSEEQTPDPLTEKLHQFTPRPLDVDALLFEAGRASAKPNLGWKILCFGLLLSHAVWVVLWCWPVASKQTLPTAAQPVSVVPSETEPLPSSPAPDSSYLAYWQQISATGELPPAVTLPAHAQDDHLLTAFQRRFPID